MRRGLLALLTVVLGCHAALPLGAPAPLDAADPDHAGRDAGGDAYAQDGGKKDAPEGGPPADGKPLDAWPLSDVPQSPDQPLASPACAAGATVQMIYPSTTGAMVFCKTIGGNQCMAASRCATGWHLCLPSEYLARGGDKTPSPAGTLAWIGGCAVADAKMTKYTLTNGPCAKNNCVAELPSGSAPAYWNCAGGSTAYNNYVSELGVSTSQKCQRVTADAKAYEGYWLTVPPQNTFAVGSLCCD
jgi:hypothetical protein